MNNHTPDSSNPLLNMPHYRVPPIAALIRSTPEDFIVEEIPLIHPDGEGEHLWLLIEKRAENTVDLVRRLGRICNLAPVAIGYAGRKDKHALAHQWFSLHLPGHQDPSPAKLAEQGITVLHAARHSRKLKIGALAGNQFRIHLRQVKGDRETLDEHLANIAEHGVPNYFGEQRFGHIGSNLTRARAMFAGRRERDRNRRNLYISAARSALFNAILAERVRQANWNCLLPGEAVLLAGSRSYFSADAEDAELPKRLDAWDIHPSGALWGAGAPPSEDRAGILERMIANQLSDIASGLAAVGLRQERRALRLRPEALTWEWGDSQQSLTLQFQLPAGTFATSVLREVADYSDASLLTSSPL